MKAAAGPWPTAAKVAMVAASASLGAGTALAVGSCGEDRGSVEVLGDTTGGTAGTAPTGTAPTTPTGTTSTSP